MQLLSRKIHITLLAGLTLLAIVGFSAGVENSPTYDWNFLSENIPPDTPKVVNHNDSLVWPLNENYSAETKQDNHFELEEPSNIQTEIVYDPETNSYVIMETVGDSITYRPASEMTLEEYMEYQNQQEVKDYWREKLDQTTDNKGVPLIPQIDVDNEKFASFFGSNTIEIRPQGTAEIALGVNTSKFENPILPIDQRRQTNLDFNQKIQLNLVGKIGEKLKLTAAYNTEATFNFENDVKLEYTGFEDDIIQKIELGQVSMPLSTSLIQGTSRAFGARTHLRWGKFNLYALASQEKTQRREISVQGGAQVRDFEVEVDDYEEDRHFFLNYYHHDNYDEAMKTLPTVNSEVNITRIEVWVTNRNSRTENTRNILAFADLGEPLQDNYQGAAFPTVTNPTSILDSLPKNGGNNLYNYLVADPNIRSFNNATSALGNTVLSPGPFEQGVDYEKVENARLLAETEFDYNSQLGFISLKQPLNNDEVLAVAYEYTFRGETYRIGEFSTDGTTAQEALYLKLLKSTIRSPKNKIWKLMMKNVYSLGAYQLSQNNFRLGVWYLNPETAALVNYIPQPEVEDSQLVSLIGMDRLNQNNQQYPDGTFDFVPVAFEGNRFTTGGTINTRNGRVFFTSTEPFGSNLADAMSSQGMDQTRVNSIAFKELYDSTKTAARQIPGKNRFRLKGTYESAVSSDISLNAFNIPEGSVVITAGGTTLVEGVDYTVDYNLGRVKILNSGYLESNIPLKISIQTEDMFGLNQKGLFGARGEYIFNNTTKVGMTVMNLTQKPITQNVNVGDEPISNTVFGADATFQSDLPWLTKAVDWLPVISTKQPSVISAQGEFAYFLPGVPSAIRKRDDGTSYIDAFEGAQSTIDLKSFGLWSLASVPRGQPDLFPEAELEDNPISGYNRGMLSWYTIDQVFFNNSQYTPAYFRDNVEHTQNPLTRSVQKTELFPNQDLQQFDQGFLNTFDLAFYPRERGMYNYDHSDAPAYSAGVDADGYLANPDTRWAGIQRALITTDFEQNNIEYLQFWVLDPFNDSINEDGQLDGGDLYFNFGNVSEDVLNDSRKSFENGIPTPDSDGSLVDTTGWGRVSTQQVVVNTFDNDPVNRPTQDVGLDGWNSDTEAQFYQDYVDWINSSALPQARKDELLADISSDDYTYFLDDNYDADNANILERYKKFSNYEGNSATSEQSQQINADGYPTSRTTIPDNEDINGDNNLSETESYFQYRVSIRQADTAVGTNYITSVQYVDNGTSIEKWYQFKVPLREPQKTIGSISDFRSIRFMRMFMSGFADSMILRFAKLELLRGEWREYRKDLTTPQENIEGDPDQTIFNVGAVNIEENSGRDPINYVIPPGIERQVDYSTNVARRMNEQSLSLRVENLMDGDARAVTKNTDFDVLSYKKLRMYIHAEYLDQMDPVLDDEVTVFVRLGSDFEANYYEYEIPLKISEWYNNNEYSVWPDSNNMEITLSDLTDAKLARNAALEDGEAGVSMINEYIVPDPKYPNRRIKVIGAPSLNGIKTIMIGVRNPGARSDNPWKPDDGQKKSVEVWVNELRMTDFQKAGGWATTGRMNIQAADFANVSFSGAYSTPGWGSLENRVSELQRETIGSFDVATTMQMGQFLGKKVGIDIPLFVGYNVNFINPQFDPLNPDVRFTEYQGADRTERIKLSQDITERTAVNLTNVRRVRPAGKKMHFWDVENLVLNFGYSNISHRDINVEYDNTRIFRGGYNYIYNGQPKEWKPFASNSNLKSPWLKWVKEFNFILGPKSLGHSSTFYRSYNERLVRNVNDLTGPNLFDPVYLKKFTWDRTWDFKYDLTRNLKFDFSAINMAIINEPYGQINKEDAVSYDEFKDSVWTSLKRGGEDVSYNHNMNVNWNLPLNQLPLTDWMTVNTRYNSSYSWNRAAWGQEDYGSIIQNSRTFSINGQANFLTLYNKVPWFKKINQGGRGRAPRRPSQAAPPKKDPNEEEKPMTDKEKKKEEKRKEKEKRKAEREKKEVSEAGKWAGQALMMIRNFNGQYSLTNGTLLPGYNQNDVFMMGLPRTNAMPMVGFVFGQQSTDWFGRDNGYNIASQLAAEGYLVQNTKLNQQYTRSTSEQYSFKTTIEPIKYLRINLTMNRNETANWSEYYRWDDTTQTYQSQTQMLSGVLGFTNITIGTAFSKELADNSIQSFEDFLNARQQVSEVLALPGDGQSADGYYGGYGATQQDVLIGAFLTSYSGRNVNEKSVNPFSAIPLPNWDITYDGLSKMKKLRKRVRNFNISHRYSSTFAIASYTTNLESGLTAPGQAPDPNNTDMNGNYRNYLQVLTVTIQERFNPLIKFDATWNIGSKKTGLITTFAWNRDRSMTLSLSNNQITEVYGNEIVIGGGYKTVPIKMPFKFLGKAVESAFNIRVDLSIRENNTIIRKIVEGTNQVTAGNTITSIRTAIDYNLGQNLNIRAYYDQVLTKPKISTAFPTSNINAGLALRFTISALP